MEARNRTPLSEASRQRGKREQTDELLEGVSLTNIVAANAAELQEFDSHKDEAVNAAIAKLRAAIISGEWALAHGALRLLHIERGFDGPHDAALADIESAAAKLKRLFWGMLRRVSPKALSGKVQS